LTILGSVLVDRQNTLEECAIWARELFEEWYVRKPMQLLHTFPLDAKDSAGQPFWQGTRRPPRPTPYDTNNNTHTSFIIASSYLRAYTLKLISSEFKPSDMANSANILTGVAAKHTVKSWSPQDNVKIAFDPEKEKEQQQTGVSAEDEREMSRVLQYLPNPQSLKGWSMNVLEFEKDDDRNFHIDFVHTAANLRAVAYDIPTVSRLQAKLIAGKIIPAIVTTTAVVAGLVCLELYKLTLGLNKLEHYRNCFANLAIPVFNMAEAVKPASYTYKGKTYTTWDSVKINIGDVTLGQLIEVLKRDHNIVPYTVSMQVKTGVKPLYMSFGDFSRELATPVSQLAREHLALDPLQRCVRLIVTNQDDDSDDDCMDVGPEKPEAEQDQFPPVWFFFK